MLNFYGTILHQIIQMFLWVIKLKVELVTLQNAQFKEKGGKKKMRECFFSEGSNLSRQRDRPTRWPLHHAYCLFD